MATATTRTPLPKLQVLVVFLVQLAEPLTASVIYPFAPEFVRRTGITGGDETKIGYYAGLIESAFFIAECLSVYHWGRAADKLGRRPILLLGPIGLGLSMLGFGLSSNFWFLVLFRCLQGIFNGNIGVSKTVIGELTDSTNIGDVFALMPFVWCVGSSTGPIIGGMLANPEQRWPIFGRLLLFRTHPYLLPCSIVAGFTFIIFILALIVLKETHPTIDHDKKHAVSSAPLLGDHSDDYGATEDAISPVARKNSPSFREIANRNVIRVIVAYGFSCFNCNAYDILQPLMYSTSIPVGGLGLNPYEIGLIMSTWGIINAPLQIFLGRFLIRRLGPRGAFIASTTTLIFSFSAFSFESYFARRAGHVDWRVIVLLLLAQGGAFMLSTSFGAGHVLVIQAATSRETLGATNGLAQMVTSGVRGISPSLASSLFSLTLEKNLLDGFGVYVVIMGSMVLGLRAALRIPNMG